MPFPGGRPVGLEILLPGTCLWMGWCCSFAQSDVGAGNAYQRGVRPVFCFQVKADRPAPAVFGDDGEALTGYAEHLSFVGLPELVLDEGLGGSRFRHWVNSLGTSWMDAVPWHVIS